MAVKAIPLSRRRGALVASSVAIGALALPATSSAASNPPTLSFGPVKVKGYDMSGSVSYGEGGETLYLSFDRSKNGSTQSHEYTFTHVNYKPKGDLSAGTLKANLGKYGKVNLTFRKAGGAKSSNPPKGCTGPKSKYQAGTLRGDFKLVADQSFFKTVKSKSFKATQASSPVLNCKSQGPTGDPFANSVVLEGGLGSGLNLSVTQPPSGPVTESASVSSFDANAVQYHSISTTVPRSSFTYAGDYSSAHAQAGGPFLTGSAAFSKTSGCPGQAQGTVSGDFAAKFDSIGTQRLVSGGSIEGMLYKGSGADCPAPPDQGSSPPDQGSTSPSQGSTPPSQGSTPPSQGSTPPSQNPPPAHDGSGSLVADFSWTQRTDPDTPLTVDFQDQSDDRGGSGYYTVRWNFGDGTGYTDDSTGRGLAFSHPYPGPGTYTVTLTMTDNDGRTATVSKQVTVSG